MILDAASEVFAANGFDQASMREIAKAAAVTTPVLYDHFRSKIDLYVAVVRQHAESLVANWSNAEGPSPATSSPEALFRRTSTTFFSWIRRNESSWRILFLDNPRDPAAVQAHQEVRDLTTEAMAGLVARLPSGGRTGPIEVTRSNRAIAAQLTGAGNALVTWWWDNRDISTEAVVQLNFDLMWHGLRQLHQPLQR